MARNKEAIAIVLDCGANVNNAPTGSPNFLEESLRCIRLILQRKIFSESKDEVALIVFGTEDTDNPLDDGHSYQNVVVKRELMVANLGFIKDLQEIRPSAIATDFIDALIVAADYLKTQMENGKFAGQQMYIFSNFGGTASADKLDIIIRALKSSDFKLSVIGYDLEDADINADLDYPKAKTDVQRKNEKYVRKMLDQLDGASFSFQEADSMLSFFKKRTVRPMPWKVNLEISKSLKIPVCLYLKIKKIYQKPWKKSYGNDPTLKLMVERSYHKQDEAQTEYEKADTVEAYRYGKSLVPFSAEDRANMAYRNGGKSFAVLAFAKQQCIKRHHFLGDSVYYVAPDKAYPPAVVALSALIHAMYETGLVAIVRCVRTGRSNPKIGFIAPIIETDLECLSFIQLPFMEDLRMYTFPPLNSNPKNVPSGEQLVAIDELITKMDLTRKDSKGKTKEILKPESIPNPYVQHLYQCMLQRGLNPDESLPKPDERIMKILKPDPQILSACQPVTENLKELFPLKVVEIKKDKKTGAVLFEDGPKDAAMDGANSDVTLDNGMAFKGAVTEVGTANPTENFLEMIKSNPQELEKCCEQMQKIILQLVLDSFGKTLCQLNYKKAIECILALRKEASMSLPNQFNKFMEVFKDNLFSKGKLDFWETLCAENIGLVTKNESPLSTLSDEEAAKYFMKTPEKDQPSNDTVDEDLDDLLDDL